MSTEKTTNAAPVHLSTQKLPPTTGTYLVGVRTKDGKLRKGVAKYIHPATSPHESPDWREQWFDGEIEVWGEIPEIVFPRQRVAT